MRNDDYRQEVLQSTRKAVGKMVRAKRDRERDKAGPAGVPSGCGRPDGPGLGTRQTAAFQQEYGGVGERAGHHAEGMGASH